MGIVSEAHEEYEAEIRAHHAAELGKLTAELELLRTIAHCAMGQVSSDGEPGVCADDPQSRRALAAFLNDWIEIYEQPRLDARDKEKGT